MTGIYAENSEGIFKKAVLEAASYAAQISNGNVTAVCIGTPNAGEADKLANYGVNKLICIDGISTFDAQVYGNEVAKVFFCKFFIWIRILLSLHIMMASSFISYCSFT